jgi:hypothetical protein
MLKGVKKKTLACLHCRPSPNHSISPHSTTNIYTHFKVYKLLKAYIHGPQSLHAFVDTTQHAHENNPGQPIWSAKTLA